MDVSKSMSLRLRSTLVDRFLLVSFIVLIPLQTYFPTYGGASVTFLCMTIILGYLVFLRPKALLKTLMHPVILTGFVFMGISFVMEFLHESDGYGTVRGIGLMVLGGAAVAALCRDRKALLFALYGYLGASIIVVLVLMLTAFGKLSAVQAGDFDEASQARVQVYSKKPLGNDINTLAFHAGQGVVAALVLGLSARSVFQKFLVIVVGIFLVIGTFLPMSRGGVAILMASCAAVIYSYGLMRPKVILISGIFFLSVLVLVPGAVLTRFGLTSQGAISGDTESRVPLILAVFDHFHEFWLIGVGEKAFFGKWGKSSSFYDPNSGEVIGAHNGFFHVTILWGLPGLLALLAVVWKAYKYFPKNSRSDPLKLFLLGISISVLLESLAIHVLSGKEFSLALGLIVGSSLWIWPYKGLRLERKIKKVKFHRTKQPENSRADP